MSDQPLNYDTVAVALLNAFSKADMEDEKDNSLAVPTLLLRFSLENCTRTILQADPNA